MSRSLRYFYLCSCFQIFFKNLISKSDPKSKQNSLMKKQNFQNKPAFACPSKSRKFINCIVSTISLHLQGFYSGRKQTFIKIRKPNQPNKKDKFLVMYISMKTFLRHHPKKCIRKVHDAWSLKLLVIVNVSVFMILSSFNLLVYWIII